MAIDRNYLLDLLSRVRSFDSSRDWEVLSDAEKNLLEEFAIYYGSTEGIDTPSGVDVLAKLKNPKEAKEFIAILQSLESIEAAFDEVTVGTIPPEILAEYQEYLKEVRAQAAKPGVVSPTKSLSDTIKKAQYFYQLRLKAEAIRAAHLAVEHPHLDPVKDAATIAAIVSAEAKENNDIISATVRQRKDPVEVITKPIADLSTLYVTEVAAALNVPLNADQKNEAVLTLAQFLYSGNVVDFVDPLTDDPDQALPAAKIQLASRNLVGATATILRETIRPTAPTAANTPFDQARDELDAFLTRDTIPISPREQQPAPTLSPDTIHQIETISANIVADYRKAETLQNASKNVYTVQLKLASASLPRYSSVDLPFLTDIEIEAVIRAYQRDHPGDLVKPTLIQTYNTEKIKSAIRTADPSDKHHLSGVKAYSQGIHLNAIRAITSAKSGSELDKLAKQKPNLVSRLIKTIHPVEASPLGQKEEISSRTPTVRAPILNPIRRAFDSTFGAASRTLIRFSDVIGSRSPALGRVVNFIRSPLQSALRPVFAWAGRQAGTQVARQFISNIATKAIGKIASEGVKKVAQTLISQGLKEGIKALVIQGAAALGIDLAVGATGIGLPAAVVMVAIQLGLLTLEFVGSQLIKKQKDIQEQAIGAAFMFTQGVSLFFTGLTAAAVATGMTLAIISIISILLGVTTWIAIENVAPLISTIAQLESASAAPYQIVSGGVVPEGCPSGWPVASGYVTQGPRTTSTHYQDEAIDIGVPNGTPIIATHNGLARYNSALDVYGNFVDVTGNCNGIAFTTRYAHLMNGAFVGERLIAKGEIIGYSDNTGNSTGPHLHYEIRGGNLGDINQFLPKRVAPGCIDFSNCQVTLP